MKRIPKIFLAIEGTRGYGRGLLKGISHYARIHGPWMFLTKHDFYHGGSHRPPSGKDLIDGAIVREASEKEMAKIQELGIPLVVACHLSATLPCPHVITDCEQVGRMAAAHFIDSGFRHFAFCGTGELFWNQCRRQSFAAAVAAAGYETHVYPYPAAAKNRLWNREQVILADWLATLPKPIAILACTDDRARDLMEACGIAGLRVPEEVAILGVDNDELACNMTAVPISSVAFNLEQAGYEAAELLDRLMQGKKPKSTKIVVRPTHIEERRSTDILAVDDPYVAQAIRFIQAHANQPLQVADVARELAISERNLYDRFQRTLGKSVFDEITRVRIAKISWMLETTHLSVKEISTIMGMPDDKHLSRYFQGHKGMSPLAWRKQQGRGREGRL
jgi:LacI family transcriptional regulator